MDLHAILAAAVLRSLAELEPARVLAGQAIATKGSQRRRFPAMDFYGNEVLPCGMMGHRHDRPELAVVVEGSVNIAIGEQLYDARQGDWALFRPNVPHGEAALASGGAYQLLWLIRDRKAMVLHATRYTRRGGYQVLTGCRIDPAGADVAAAWQALVSADPTDVARIRLALLRVICEALGHVTGREPNGHAWAHPLIAEVRRCIDEHRGKPPTVVELANHVGLSPNYLSDLFHRRTGTTLRHYTDQVRIDRAKELLLDPGRSIKSVAYELGFADPPHFSRVFRRVAGISAAAFRAGAEKQTRLR